MADTDKRVSIMDALKRVQNSSILVPAMQREFVWTDEQITSLFDSAMRGYPIGVFLVWRVSKKTAQQWPWFQCHTNLHREITKSKPSGSPLSDPVDAVLDGQQRLTAFNIGIHGSIIVAKPGQMGHESRYLWIDVAHTPKNLEPGQPLYRFEFHPLDWDETAPTGKWIRVGAVASCDSKRDIRAIVGRSISADELQVLETLRLRLSVDALVSWEIVENDDLDSILNIFIRANTKGTQLGYDDMLIAIANSRWEKLNANLVIGQLQTGIERDLSIKISRTRIMKTALVLIGAPEIGFRAPNLRRARVKSIENDWQAIEDAIWTAAKILETIGIRKRTLTAENVIIPIAVYAHHRQLPRDWAANPKNGRDLERIRCFVFRSLLKPDFWTGAVDPVLLKCREVITSQPKQAKFPLDQITTELRKPKIGKDLSFSDDDIDRLLETQYKNRSSLLLLTAMYPEVARNGWLHKDHVFPRKGVRPGALRAAGFNADESREITEQAEYLPNLCLLSSTENTAYKRSKAPADWLDDVRTDAGPSQRTWRMQSLDLQNAPADAYGLEAFWRARRVKSRDRIKRVLLSKFP